MLMDFLLKCPHSHFPNHINRTPMITFTQGFPFSPLPLGHYRSMMTNSPYERHIDFETLIAPETPFESWLISMPEFQAGYNWGLPRFGHPEGKVGIHVKEVLENIDKLSIDSISRQQLRIVALSHDTFKYKENKRLNGHEYKHHGLLAREFMERYCDDEVVLDIVELHDEAFYIWRAANLENKREAAGARLKNLLDRIGPHFGLYFQFFKSDTQTGDKMQAPIHWFEQCLRDIGKKI